MKNTGRIQKTLHPTARRLIFGQTANNSLDTELDYISQIDLAHILMLMKCNIIDDNSGKILLKGIQQLRACHFAPLRDQSAPRGLYLLYEDYLIETLGENIGGILQTGRSRNDLNATVLRLRLRSPFLGLIKESLRLIAILLRRAQRFHQVVMPAYTHYQAAVPITYGHYLAGISTALLRDIAYLLPISTDLNRFPLGAGAVGGTSFPIDPAYTASLLGFEEIILNSIDSVASRDFILRILANITILGITLSRLANDLQLWTTQEFAFLSLPDHLVGSSSMMPQKRNPFLLEHIQGRSTSALGAFVSAGTAMHNKPFSNGIAVNTEGVASIWKAMQDMTEVMVLTRLVIADAQPNPSAMLEKAINGYTSATELANRCVAQGIPFRKAHHLVGNSIRQAIAHQETSLETTVSQWLPNIPLNGLDPTSVVEVSCHGGGPSTNAFSACFEHLQAQWKSSWRKYRSLKEQWQVAAIELSQTVENVCSCCD